MVHVQPNSCGKHLSSDSILFNKVLIFSEKNKHFERQDETITQQCLIYSLVLIIRWRFKKSEYKLETLVSGVSRVWQGRARALGAT